ncbi:MAG: ubiquinol-cytochrome c reductase iron-sulfur subunit [Caldimonas sp.]
MTNSLPADPARRFWVTATSVFGGAGLVVTAVPFVASLSPSEKARALGAPVEFGLQSLQSGDMATVEWRGKPVFVVRRSQAMLDSLARHDELLADPNSQRTNEPDYARNGARSIKPEFLVVVGICTHLGCIPGFRPTPGSAELGASWPGGFYCPCHGSKFDLAGRVFKNVPAPTNLEVPPYQFASASTLLVGVDQAA